jgi:NAD(P)-dependent dehydrogenase (short-subunit alcohol dehydrogenase family)
VNVALEGRHALVTGAGRGLGRGAALALADAGAAVTLVARSRDELEAVAAENATADFDLFADVNLRGTFLACRAVGRHLLERGAPGRIVTVSSQMGVVGYPGRAAYCATKHAVNGLTQALAVEWAPHGVTVNAVAPTFVRTPMTEPMLADAEFAAEVRRRLPTGEVATVEEVAAAIVYLASDAARSVTGHVLAVDGGWTAW